MYIQQSSDGFRTVQFGTGGDLAQPGDYDGDGKTDVAVFKSGNWYVQGSSSVLLNIQVGAAGDVPVPAADLTR